MRNSFCNQIIRPRSILVKKPLDPRKFPSAIDPMPKTNCARTFLSGLLNRRGPFSVSRFSLPFAALPRPSLSGLGKGREKNQKPTREVNKGIGLVPVSKN